MRTPVLIGIAGGANSGKKTVCRRIVENLGRDASITILSMDSFYRELSAQEQIRVQNGDYSFDHPQAFDFDELATVLCKLIDRKPAEIPVYDYHTRKRTDQRHQQAPVDVILLEGMLVLYHGPICDMLSMKIFVDVDSDSRLSRRVVRDTAQFNRTLESVLLEYTRFVKPCFEDFVMPTKKHADIVIPRGPDNNVAIDIIIQYIQDLLQSSESKGKNGDTIRAESPDVRTTTGFNTLLS